MYSYVVGSHYSSLQSQMILQISLLISRFDAQYTVLIIIDGETVVLLSICVETMIFSVNCFRKLKRTTFCNIMNAFNDPFDHLMHCKGSKIIILLFVSIKPQIKNL